MNDLLAVIMRFDIKGWHFGFSTRWNLKRSNKAELVE